MLVNRRAINCAAPRRGIPRFHGGIPLSAGLPSFYSPRLRFGDVRSAEDSRRSVEHDAERFTLQVSKRSRIARAASSEPARDIKRSCYTQAREPFRTVARRVPPLPRSGLWRINILFPFSILDGLSHSVAAPTTGQKDGENSASRRTAHAWGEIKNWTLSR